jgi:hypothetical protein
MEGGARNTAVSNPKLARKLAAVCPVNIFDLDS